MPPIRIPPEIAFGFAVILVIIGLSLRGCIAPIFECDSIERTIILLESVFFIGIGGATMLMIAFPIFIQKIGNKIEIHDDDEVDKNG